MLRPSRHPYQATTLPQPHLHVRNPWVEKPESSTNSSCGSRSGRTRHTTSQPTSEWLLPRNQTLSHQGPLLNQQIQPVIVSARGPGSAVSTTRESSGGVSAAGGIGSCGGQCIACETFCYYFLQVIFIAGILTGIALTIAGSVLHGNQREGDLVVLMYIGVLLVLVCILLLSVHCCVRRNVKQRKRALRMTLMDGSRRLVHPVSGDFTAIPVQDFTADANYRNSFAETNLNEFEVADSSRAQLNVIPNPTYNYQYRQSTTNRSGGFQMNAGRPAHDWGRSSHPTGVHRSSFR
ncbi:hypothetical protein RUM43_004494 [Polyplax serrata]|uniref:Uncharacterized protein n=1 Tax=Polyplax serrata TaxID=468196 RepID=A0AAN8SCL2_POLSC